MDDSLKQIAETHDLTLEASPKKYTRTDDREVGVDYYVKGLRGIPDLPVLITCEEDIVRLQRVVESESILLEDLIGYRDGEGIYVLARNESFRYIMPGWDSSREEPLRIRLSYGSKAVSIEIGLSPEGSLIDDIASLVSLRRSPFVRRKFCVSLRGLGGSGYLQNTLEQDIEAILDSIFYDLDLTYGLGLLPMRVEAMRRTVRRRGRPRLPLPLEPLNLIYKDYSPELLQYYRLAKRTDYLPFRFLCYFHILEYFADRSAFSAVTEAVKRMLAKHDFHAKSEKYVRDCVQVFRRESDKHTSDKQKLQRVISQFVEPEVVREALDDMNVLAHFEQECILDCAKPLKLAAISFESESKFFQTLNTRIYALRCAIVHSNPDFDEAKAIPFVASPGNLEKLRLEITIAEEVARHVIAGSSSIKA